LTAEFFTSLNPPGPPPPRLPLNLPPFFPRPFLFLLSFELFFSGSSPEKSWFQFFSRVDHSHTGHIIFCQPGWHKLSGDLSLNPPFRVSRRIRPRVSDFAQSHLWFVCSPLVSSTSDFLSCCSREAGGSEIPHCSILQS